MPFVTETWADVLGPGLSVPAIVARVPPQTLCELGWDATVRRVDDTFLRGTLTRA